MTAGTSLAQRWVVQYNFYLHDRQWGRLFVRMCPSFPFSARICLNQHHWLATRLRAEGIAFRQCANAFVACRNPTRLQQLADALTARDLLRCGQKWLTYLTPFFTAPERQHAGCQHRLFFAQVEYCDNLLFHRRAALDALGARLLDANRTIGQPNKIATIFRRSRRQRRLPCCAGSPWSSSRVFPGATLGSRATSLDMDRVIQSPRVSSNRSQSSLIVG
jgi:hypothetical protein